MLPFSVGNKDLNLQRLHLSQQQVGEVFTQEQDSCVVTETSKKGAKYMDYEASDSAGMLWVWDNKELASKSATDSLSVF